jgi:hypothetical protein
MNAAARWVKGHMLLWCTAVRVAVHMQSVLSVAMCAPGASRASMLEMRRPGAGCNVAATARVSWRSTGRLVGLAVRLLGLGLEVEEHRLRTLTWHAHLYTAQRARQTARRQLEQWRSRMKACTPAQAPRPPRVINFTGAPSRSPKFRGGDRIMTA